MKTLTPTQHEALKLVRTSPNVIDGVLYAFNGVSLSTARNLVNRGLAQWVDGSTRYNWGIKLTTEGVALVD